MASLTRIERCHCSHVDIRGYTDSVGKPEYNQKLSERRANAVKDYLEAHGVAAGVLSAQGFGEENPIASNATKEGRAANRRVTVRFIGSRPAVMGQARAARAARAPCGRIRRADSSALFFPNAHGLEHDGRRRPIAPPKYSGCGRSSGSIEFAEALEAAEALLEQVPDQRDALLSVAVAQRYLGRPDEALGTLATLERHHPRFSRLYEERGRCFVDLKQAPQAIEAFSTAVNLNHALTGQLAHARGPLSHGRPGRARPAGGGPSGDAVATSRPRW